GCLIQIHTLTEAGIIQSIKRRGGHYQGRPACERVDPKLFSFSWKWRNCQDVLCCNRGLAHPFPVGILTEAATPALFARVGTVIRHIPSPGRSCTMLPCHVFLVPGLARKTARPGHPLLTHSC